MNPFKSPNSNLDNNINNRNINWPKTLVFSLLSMVAAYISAFILTNIITSFILGFIDNSTMNTFLIVDALTTFTVLVSTFIMMALFKNTHNSIVVYSGALFMFVFWGIESGAFFFGLNPQYPAWFEINMAINDLAAAMLALFIVKRITIKSSSPANNASLDLA